MRHILFMLLCTGLFSCIVLPSLSAVERSVEDFKSYAARRLANVEEERLEKYVAEVDKDGDGKITDAEFRGRIEVYLRLFKRVAVKPQTLGHGLPENWLTDWDKALAQSRETGKPILAMFSASWCGPCKNMIRTVFPTEEAQNALEAFVPVYIDSEKIGS